MSEIGDNNFTTNDMNLHIYPPKSSIDGKKNVFIDNLHECIPDIYRLKSDTDKPALISLFHHLFDSDIYIFNWPENVIFKRYGYIQFLVLKSILKILKRRKVKIIWIFHNMIPHQGHNDLSLYVYQYFFENSTVIVTFSETAKAYLKGKTTAPVLCCAHPFNDKIYNLDLKAEKSIDILIWGSINKYKGLYEFLQYYQQSTDKHGLTIYIVGRCIDEDYANKLLNIRMNNVTFLNEYASDERIIQFILKSKYVVFPYNKESISGSGALMFSLENGATVIGPNTGAFKDLQDQNLCLTFDEYSDIFELVSSGRMINTNDINRFIKENLWSNFFDKISNYLQ